MKKILISCLLLMQLNNQPSTHEAVIFNLNTDTFYLVEYTEALTEIHVRHLNEKARIPIACMSNEVVALNKINFSASPKCLMNSLNNAFQLSIDSYIDMQNKMSLDELKQLADKKNLMDMLKVVQSVRTNISIMTFYSLYDTYSKLDQLHIIHEYPFLLKTETTYLPLSTFIEP